jgi:acyl-homoserine-lactone acylase
MNVDSRGAALFVEFWDVISKDPSVYAVPFDAADPVHTPRGLKRDAETSAKVTAALAEAVERLGARHVALDAPWGDVQFAVRGDQHIPIHGGPGLDGVLDAQQSAWTDGLGYIPFHGSSYMQVVTFDANGPVADGLLSYSQSTDPASPHYADQTWLFSRKQWNHLPFSDADIASQAISHEHISE